MAVHITLAESRKKTAVPDAPKHLVTPGDVITADTGYMRGHGTYMDDDKLKASLAGVVERVNKLICVQPLKTRYNGEIGDVVVGRVSQVGQKRWRVDVNSRLDAVLMLSAVNLPGGELRRRSAEDELMMREYLQEGDLISAEVQAIFHDGALSLHTRSLKYGKLSQGVMVQVSPSLVKRRKTHFHNLACGASVILGNNGYVWISPTVNDERGESSGGMSRIWRRLVQVVDLICLEKRKKKQSKNKMFPSGKPVPSADREVIARLRNCILALATHKLMLYDTSVLYAYEASRQYQVKDLLQPDVAEKVADDTRQRLQMDYVVSVAQRLERWTRNREIPGSILTVARRCAIGKEPAGPESAVPATRGAAQPDPQRATEAIPVVPRAPTWLPCQEKVALPLESRLEPAKFRRNVKFSAPQQRSRLEPKNRKDRGHPVANLAARPSATSDNVNKHPLRAPAANRPVRVLPF
ncbi:Exosome complex component RRP4 [Branchiostoma belcheri]|nr:Exosome complex component RRP4 [Branchiostoma belcheri]